MLTVTLDRLHQVFTYWSTRVLTTCSPLPANILPWLARQVRRRTMLSNGRYLSPRTRKKDPQKRQLMFGAALLASVTGSQGEATKIFLPPAPDYPEPQQN